MIGRTNIASGGGKIDELIEQYQVQSGNNISAGDFVSFVNKYGSHTLIISSNNTGEYTSAIRLDRNKVFIAHSYSSNAYLYGAICTINDVSITKDADVQLSSDTNSGKYISAVLLSNNKIFISHPSGTSYALKGMICSVEGTTTTVLSDNYIRNITGAGYYTNTVTLAQDKVFIAYQSPSSTSLSSIVVSINSDNTLSVGTETYISGKSSSGQTNSIVALDGNRVFASYYYTESSSKCYGKVVCNISGTTITTGTAKQDTSSDYYASYTFSVKLAENIVFTDTFFRSSNTNSLRGQICKIAGDSIAAVYTGNYDINGASGAINTGSYVKAVLLSEKKVFVNYKYGSLYAAIITINDDYTGYTVDSREQMSTSSGSGTWFSSPLLEKNKVFMSYNGSSGFNFAGKVKGFNAKKLTSSTDEILGVAKTGGTGGQTIDVYVPN